MEMTWCAIVVTIKSAGPNPSSSRENRGRHSRGGEIASNLLTYLLYGAESFLRS